MTRRGPLAWVRRIGVAALLVLTMPVTVLAEWSEWMPLNREPGVWARIEMSPPVSEQRVHYQFRNDGDQAVEIDCTLGSYVIAPPTYKRLTDVRLRLFPVRVIRNGSCTASIR